MAIKVENDRYIQGYDDGYAAGLKARQMEVDFLLNLLQQPREVVIPFELSERTKELFKKKISEHDTLKAFQEREEKQREAVKRFVKGLDGELYNGME